MLYSAVYQRYLSKNIKEYFILRLPPAGQSLISRGVGPLIRLVRSADASHFMRAPRLLRIFQAYAPVMFVYSAFSDAFFQAKMTYESPQPKKTPLRACYEPRLTEGPLHKIFYTHFYCFIRGQTSNTVCAPRELNLLLTPLYA